MSVNGALREGGGQIVRNAVSLSVLLNMSLRVYNIRGARPRPGLRTQHVAGIDLMRRLMQVEVQGNTLGSTEVVVHKRDDKSAPREWPRKIVADTNTAGSVCLLLQIALPSLIFAPSITNLTMIGGTNASMAPTIDYANEVFLPMLRRLMHVDTKLFIEKRGFYPRGGGKVTVTSYPRQCPLPAFEFIDRGEIHSITITSIVSGDDLPMALASRATTCAAHHLKYIQWNIDYSDQIL